MHLIFTTHTDTTQQSHKINSISLLDTNLSLVLYITHSLTPPHYISFANSHLSIQILLMTTESLLISIKRKHGNSFHYQYFYLFIINRCCHFLFFSPSPFHFMFFYFAIALPFHFMSSPFTSFTSLYFFCIFT